MVMIEDKFDFECKKRPEEALKDAFEFLVRVRNNTIITWENVKEYIPDFEKKHGIGVEIREITEYKGIKTERIKVKRTVTLSEAYEFLKELNRQYEEEKQKNIQEEKKKDAELRKLEAAREAARLAAEKAREEVEVARLKEDVFKITEEVARLKDDIRRITEEVAQLEEKARRITEVVAKETIADFDEEIEKDINEEIDEDVDENVFDTDYNEDDDNDTIHASANKTFVFPIKRNMEDYFHETCSFEKIPGVDFDSYITQGMKTKYGGKIQTNIIRLNDDQEDYEYGFIELKKTFYFYLVYYSESNNTLDNVFCRLHIWGPIGMSYIPDGLPEAIRGLINTIPL